jgi:hypothetical protein
MGDPHAVPVLKSVLIDATREPIVRHEAAEALAAIADPQVLPLLRQYVSDPVQVITSYDTFSKHDLIRKVVLYKSAPDPAPIPPKNLASANLGRNDLKIHQNDWTTHYSTAVPKSVTLQFFEVCTFNRHNIEVKLRLFLSL